MKSIEDLTKEEESSLMRKCQKCKDLKLLNDFFYRNKERKLRSSYCKKCFMIRNTEYNKKNPEALKDRKKREYKKNKRRYLDTEYKRKYGIGLEEVENKLKNQGGVCKICGQKDESKKGFHLDHCHKTKIVRDVLCNHCNRLLGACKENIEILSNSIEYLTRWKN